eukprot:TRINITY_DN83997_c0_g1_i1.p1 TRINITY_DN83997_c0_g1~~TRINITY_DN83997_c0_g1_i1.p1  ORF type:complete len:588 (+),score=81.76 TRINITY_DN83997_c0_g1_i1:57-1820(+)
MPALATSNGGSPTALLTAQRADDLITAMDTALTQADAASGSRVKRSSVQVLLAEELVAMRNFMLDVLGDSAPGRRRLLDIFGGSCERIAKVYAILDAAALLELADLATDASESCRQACISVEKVLQDLGLGGVVKEARREERIALGKRASGGSSVRSLANDIGIVAGFGVEQDVPGIAGAGAVKGCVAAQTVVPVVTAGYEAQVAHVSQPSAVMDGSPRTAASPPQAMGRQPSLLRVKTEPLSDRMPHIVADIDVHGEVVGKQRTLPPEAGSGAAAMLEGSQRPSLDIDTIQMGGSRFVVRQGSGERSPGSFFPAAPASPATTFRTLQPQSPSGFILSPRGPHQVVRSATQTSLVTRPLTNVLTRVRSVTHNSGEPVRQDLVSSAAASTRTGEQVSEKAFAPRGYLSSATVTNTGVKPAKTMTVLSAAGPQLVQAPPVSASPRPTSVALPVAAPVRVPRTSMSAKQVGVPVPAGSVSLSTTRRVSVALPIAPASSSVKLEGGSPAPPVWSWPMAGQDRAAPALATRPAQHVRSVVLASPQMSPRVQPAAPLRFVSSVLPPTASPAPTASVAQRQRKGHWEWVDGGFI